MSKVTVSFGRHTFVPSRDKRAIPGLLVPITVTSAPIRKSGNGKKRR